MLTIRNINEAYGEPMEFSGETLADAVHQMQTAVRNCGPEFSDVIVTRDDYQVVESAPMWTVQVRKRGGWRTHSTHASYCDAIDQAYTVHGRVVVAATGVTNLACYKYAYREQGFSGSYRDWQMLEDDERMEYEHGAGMP